MNMLRRNTEIYKTKANIGNLLIWALLQEVDWREGCEGERVLRIWIEGKEDKEDRLTVGQGVYCKSASWKWKIQIHVKSSVPSYSFGRITIAGEGSNAT